MRVYLTFILNTKILIFVIFLQKYGDYDQDDSLWFNS
jgi:hypothetical protein